MRIDRPSRWALRLRTALLVLVLTASSASAQSGPVQYGYDELGRLVVVVDGAGNTAIYNYDAVGNLLSIQRVNPGDIAQPVAITAVVPTRGRVGTPVSIFGKGFSSTPAQNAVSFNGGLATVTSASTTALRVTVPATAVDGSITVTAPAGSATWPGPFRVIGPLTVTPAGASTSPASSLQFTATSPGGYSPPVIWAVNGITGGNASVGTISTGGLYTAPTYMTQQTIVTIAATDQADATLKGSTTATVIPRRLSVAQAVSVVIGGEQINRSLQTAVSVRVGGEPSAVATTAVSVSRGPVITGVSPATGARGATGLTVTLTGAFIDATQVTFLRNNVADASITASLVSVSPDGTQATLQLSIASGAATGARVVQITTPAGTSTVVGTGSNVFTVQ